MVESLEWLNNLGNSLYYHKLDEEDKLDESCFNIEVLDAPAQIQDHVDIFHNVKWEEIEYEDVQENVLSYVIESGFSDGGMSHSKTFMAGFSFLDYLGLIDLESRKFSDYEGLVTEEKIFGSKVPDIAYLSEKVVIESGNVDRQVGETALCGKIRKMIKANQEEKPEDYTFYQIPYNSREDGIFKVELNEKGREIVKIHRQNFRENNNS